MPKSRRGKLKCAVCGLPTWVSDSLHVKAKDLGVMAVRRRRKCANGHRMTTYEVAKDDIEGVLLASTESDSAKVTILLAVLSTIRNDIRDAIALVRGFDLEKGEFVKKKGGLDVKHRG